MTDVELESIAVRILATLPSVLVLVDRDVRIQYMNSFGESLIGKHLSEALNWRVGDLFRCIHSFEGSSGCGSGPSCTHCRIRNSVNSVFAENRRIREESDFLTKDGMRYSFMINASLIHVHNVDLVVLYLEDLHELKELQDLLPICMKCHKVRNSNSYWQNVESYLKEHNGVSVSHGLCDDCLERYYPEQKGSK